ncbi:class I SAM-dependent methyltransferase [Streptomyces sp. AC627_RSS907]|uniref:class I SAM-dependent methyltransferase n=1 Tax=Streptomyces sp. AC627_RSS907 TaxID=2823684 RepID=UPI001C22E6F3|nr:class I SAM-dependent methyltransferase [Streptomyces sp. AC627_RSS907]
MALHTSPSAHAGPGHHEHGHGHAADAADALAEALDLDAELFGFHLTSALDSLASLLDDRVTAIVDLGAGSGTGTLALLERFPGATVTAVDTSPAMLTKTAAKARARGFGERVRTLRADAGRELPGIEGADLVWAASSLHHLDDPAAALSSVRAALRPGGLLAVSEMDGMPRFLPEEAVAERPGLEARCREALSALHAEQVPHLGADWGTLLRQAGYIVEAERTEQLKLTAPLPAATGRYAHLVLERVRSAVADRLEAADVAALDTLLDGGPHDVRHRDDLQVRSTRQLWAARLSAAGS